MMVTDKVTGLCHILVHAVMVDEQVRWSIHEKEPLHGEERVAGDHPKV